MSSGFDIMALVEAVKGAVDTKGLPYVDEQMDALREKYPDGAELFTSVRQLAHNLTSAINLSTAIPEAFADMIQTLKTGSGPVDTSGGHTM